MLHLVPVVLHTHACLSLQALLALVLLHQAVYAQDDTVRNGQSPNIVKATIEVTQTWYANQLLLISSAADVQRMRLWRTMYDSHYLFLSDNVLTSDLVPGVDLVLLCSYLQACVLTFL